MSGGVAYVLDETGDFEEKRCNTESVELEKVTPSTPEKLVTLSNDVMRVEFTSWGGGIRSVELTQHRANGHGNALLNGPGSARSGGRNVHNRTAHCQTDLNGVRVHYGFHIVGR